MSPAVAEPPVRSSASPPAGGAPPEPDADLPTLPAELADAFDAAGELVVRHPATGERLRLVRCFVDIPLTGPPVTRTLLEDVEEAQAQFAAGRGQSLEEYEAARPRRLANLLRMNGLDPRDHLPPEVLEKLEP